MSALLISCLLLIVATTLLTKGVVELRLRWLPLHSQARSALSLSWLTFAPLMTGVLLAIAMLTTMFGKYWGLIADHCEEHGFGHPHLCLEHLTGTQTHFVQASLLAFVVTILAWRLWPVVRRLRRQQNLQSRLVDIQEGPLCWLDSKQELAFVAGLHNPKVVISKALRQRLSKQTLRLVVAHEFQHIRNRDLVKMAGIELALTFYSKTARRQLREAWLAAREQRIDRQLAERFGRAVVAESLVAMLTIKQETLGMNHNGGSIEQRIHALLQMDLERPHQQRLWRFASVLLVSASLLFMTAQHHALETLIGWIN
ncbi:M56 family metallopeptidase [Pseudidiomarina sp. CB1]|uniref:M56 family metallopeptidase n=1 Tax=Pseudidiomarina sp. CB1 TaxID=2972484 RepID=UPI002163C86E|nr:M56 family metallopeptidase [Pseudidiomarina sp. CB1]